MGLSHNDAVRILKTKASHKKVELKLLDTSETAEGADNFLPTWMYWLDLPRWESAAENTSVMLPAMTQK